jgi:hypothetical protein
MHVESAYSGSGNSRIIDVSHPTEHLGPAYPGLAVIPEDGRKDGQVAKQTTVTLVDDIDGSAAEEQVEFAVDGKSYEIDLSAANSTKLREALAPYISAARRSGGRRSATPAAAAAAPPSRPAADRQQNQAIREWAVAQGMKISERGRIPSNVLQAYRESH